MAKHEITFCNRAYSKRWFKNLERQNSSHFEILQAIIAEIEDKDGGDISKADIFRRDPGINQRVAALEFDIVPESGPNAETQRQRHQACEVFAVKKHSGDLGEDRRNHLCHVRRSRSYSLSQSHKPSSRHKTGKTGISKARQENRSIPAEADAVLAI